MSKPSLLWTGFLALGLAAASPAFAQTGISPAAQLVVGVPNPLPKGVTLPPVYNAMTYGAKCDDSTDDTTAINNAITAIFAASPSTGGTLLLPGICLMNGALAIPFTGTTPPVQPPLRITSVGAAWDGTLAAGSTGGGGGLDLRYTGADTLHPAKIDTRGAGVLEIDHLIIEDGSTDNYLFLQTTNTTLNIHDNHVIGNTSCSKTTCSQDAFQLGGITDASTTLGGVLATNGFQGYGSQIVNNYFSHTRHAVNFGGSSNGVYLANNTIDKTSGSGETNGAPYVFYGAGLGSQGNVISGGIVEITGYPYAAEFTHTTSGAINKNNVIMGLGLYDEDLVTPVTIDGYYFSAAASSLLNTIIPEFLYTPLQSTAMSGSGATANTYINGGGTTRTQFPYGVSLGASAQTSYSLGSFGVLNSSPQNTLDVGDGTGKRILDINAAGSGSANGPAIYFQEVGVTKLAIGGYSAINGGAFDDTLTMANLNGGEKLRFTGTGGAQFDSGILNPGITADTGHTDATVCEDTTSHQFYSGTGTLGVCLGTSSIRFKRDTAYLTDASSMEKVMALKPVSYRYKDGYGDSGARRQYGFLAEDVVDAAPLLVHYDPQGKPNSVDYVGMIPLLVGGIQEQQREIAALKAELRRR